MKPIFKATKPFTYVTDVLLIAVLLACVAMERLAQAANYAVTVQSGSQQTFLGFGASQSTEANNANFPAATRTQMYATVYQGLHARVLRLWVSSQDNVDVTAMKNEFYPKYVDSGCISNVLADGVTTLLLAPANGHVAPANVSSYASKIAQFISDIKTERGVIINVTGIDNEPSGWTAQQIADGVKYLRADLDSLGLTSVQIVSPETASADSDCDAKIDAMHNDSTAWSAIAGIASHSYNMAARTNESGRTFGKQYWITESSDDGNELAEDPNYAATTSARFLNDMNHMVTHWIFFIGVGYSTDISTDNDDATKLLVYDHSNGNIQTNLKYFCFKQLLATFDYGAVFRKCQSSSEGDMTYTYGQKPRINVAAAVNPDGSWAIGIVNDTGVPSNPPLTSYYSAVNTNVTVTVNELTGTGNKSFTLYTNAAGAHFVNAGTVTMTNGVITVPVAAKELVCLRSAGNGLPAAPSGLTATAVSSSEIDLSWTDNATNETGFKIQRKTGSGGTYSQIATTSANTTTYHNTGLSSSTTYYYEVAATNASGSSDWSNEAGATTSGGEGGGSLSGSVGAAASTNQLTVLGTNDWTYWNGTFIHKASGGTQISDVTQIGGGSYGTWTSTSRYVTWTDGTPTASGTNDTYVWCNGTANSGWTFTAPADTSTRILHIVCGGSASATMQITAHLSDSSASDYTDTQTSGSSFTKEYTITYHAASASQTLTITIKHTNSGSPSCDLIAAWLTGGSSPSLSGSVAAASSSYNLTAVGTSDWAHRNGTFIHKSSGGTQISDVTQTGGGTYGPWTNASSTSITWSDGTPIGSGSNDQGYIWCNGTANSGWTFTVPAGTTTKTVHVICGGSANATTKLTAHLSDGSASDYTDTQTSASLFRKEYTITYQAASASQTLTITIIHTNSGSPSCDLVGAWLP